MLFSLYVMHIYWFWYMLKLIYKYVFIIKNESDARNDYDYNTKFEKAE